MLFEQIPLIRPTTPLLDGISYPADLRALDEKQLPQLARELREFLLYSVGQTGGHFGAGLGVVELTIALHYVFDTPEDRLVWDVGHQSYPHKILTGRREQMDSVRRMHGLAGFPKRGESAYDTFGVGHSSTSISAALGMALAARQNQKEQKTVAIIGDGAMTAGMAFEALNHAAHTKANILVVLNDNNMSISPNVGGLATYFSKIWASKFYTNLRESGKKVLENLPQARELAKRTEEHMKGMVSPSTLFEELGFYYVGPIDGHDLPRLTHDLANLSEIPGPKLLHVITQKGKGYAPAEKDPVGYHALNKIEPKAVVKSSEKTSKNMLISRSPAGKTDSDKAGKIKYQDLFGKWLCEQAEQQAELVAITPAMCEGSGMVSFRERFAERFFDVAIAEQHALTLAAGLACEGLKPVVAIYSTFLQRAYDQLLHDVALQNLNVTLAIDRAGLVGEDGPTHSGCFDIAFLRCIPNMVLAAPSDEQECYQLLSTALAHEGPAAVRYPRGTGPGATLDSTASDLPLGRGRLLRSGAKVLIINFGPLLPAAQNLAVKHGYGVLDMRWIKPLDEGLLLEQCLNYELLVTLEEGAIQGGAGSAVAEALHQHAVTKPLLQLGIADHFVEHASRAQQLQKVGLDEPGIERQILKRLSLIEPAQSLKLSSRT